MASGGGDGDAIPSCCRAMCDACSRHAQNASACGANTVNAVDANPT